MFSTQKGFESKTQFVFFAIPISYGPKIRKLPMLIFLFDKISSFEFRIFPHFFLPCSSFLTIIGNYKINLLRNSFVRDNIWSHHKHEPTRCVRQNLSRPTPHRKKIARARCDPCFVYCKVCTNFPTHLNNQIIIPFKTRICVENSTNQAKKVVPLFIFCSSLWHPWVIK